MSRFRNALNALLGRDLPLPKGEVAPPAIRELHEALGSVELRLTTLEAAAKDCLEVVELEADRAARWADMTTQLRRFLGRLDAHAGKDKEQENHHDTAHDPKQLAAVLRSKFPNSGV